jgi:serine/threonine protein kinase
LIFFGFSRIRRKRTDSKSSGWLVDADWVKFAETTRFSWRTPLAGALVKYLIGISSLGYAGAKAIGKNLLYMNAPATPVSPPEAEHALDLEGLPPILGPYRLLNRIGLGGMGQVYRAEHLCMKRQVALKIFTGPFLPQQDIGARFEREVQVAAQLVHPNIVTAFDAAAHGTLRYLVMEYVEGIDLGHYVEEHGPLPLPLACECVRQAALGLHHAHERGYVHGDIKPANILLKTGPDWVVKILDFGLARPANSPTEKTNEKPASLGSGFGGTPDFLAPEKGRDSHRADIRGDLYSLGCTFYYLLAGQVPYPGGTWSEKLFAHQFETAAPVEQFRADVPQEIAWIIARLMAKDPTERFQTPAELAVAISDYLSTRESPLESQPLRDQAEVKTRLQGQDLTWPSHYLMVAPEVQDPGANAHAIETSTNDAVTSQASIKLAFFCPLAVVLGLTIAWAVTALWKAPAVTDGGYFTLAGNPDRTFAGLDGALAAAGDGETIAVHGNGPFTFGPITIRQKRLTLRAGEGFHPRLVFAGFADQSTSCLSAADSFTLEGLDLELVDTGLAGNIQSPHLVYLSGGALHLVDCGLFAPHAEAMVVCRQTTALEMSHCRVFGRATPVCLEAADGCTTAIRIVVCNIHASDFRSAAIVLWGKNPDNTPLMNCVLSGSTFEAGRILSLAGLSRPIAVQAEKNHFHFSEGLISCAGTDLADAGRRITWGGSENHYHGTDAWIMLNGRASGPRNLTAWREFWKSGESESREEPASFPFEPARQVAAF